MTSLNGWLASVDLGWLKGSVSALLLPPLPLLALMAVGAVLLRRRRGALGWTSFVAGTSLVYLSCTTALGWALLQGLTQPPPALSSTAIAEIRSGAPTSKSAIVVLGGGRELFAPEYAMANLNARTLERLRYGIWLSRATGLPIAFSGGLAYSAEPGSSEAEIAARVAANEFGRPLRWTETQSRDTTENGLYTVKLLHEAGVQRILLVTHGYHMRRAMRAFERAVQREGAAIAVQAAPMGMNPRDGGWLPSVEGFMLTRFALHEWMGWLAGA